MYYHSKIILFVTSISSIISIFHNMSFHNYILNHSIYLVFIKMEFVLPMQSQQKPAFLLIML